MEKRINGTLFNIDFCKRYSEKQLRSIYRNFNEDTLDKLIAEVNGKEEAKDEKAEKPKKAKAEKE